MDPHPFDPENETDRALLDARTRAAAAPAPVFEASTAGAALALVIGSERYVLDARAVSAVAALTRLTALPHAPAHVAGLIARGGEIVPAFYLRAVLGLPLGSLPEYSRIVLLGEGAHALALVVDAVEPYTLGDVRALTEPPATVSPSTRAVLLGVDAHGVAVLSPDALRASERLFVEIPVPRELSATARHQEL